ncbi:MAG: hypothetical protein JW910_10985 [Anaerolineae bacterium]|nr:hypothetical protein [Anaerolineae bacterium]
MGKRDYDYDERPSRAGYYAGWFWLGTLIGTVLSATAVVAAAELTFRRRQRAEDPSFSQGETDLVEDLSGAVQEGLHVLARAAQEIGHSFADAKRELIRYNLEPSEITGAGSAGWYTGDEDDE